MAAFLVTVTNRPILGIKSPFQAIFLGVLVSLMVKRGDFGFFTRFTPDEAVSAAH